MAAETASGGKSSLSSSHGSPSGITPQRSSLTPSVSGLSTEAPYQFLDVAIDNSRGTPQAPTIELWGHGLELMHHYVLHTANTMSIRPDMQHVWRAVMPEIGYDCPFVMHGILTIAALHKGYLIPSERDKYLDLAASHQNAGLEAFRALLHTVDDNNWIPFFCFASLILFYVASDPVRMNKEHSLEDSPDVTSLFVFVRGIRAILEPYQSRLGKTNFGPMAQGVWIVDPGDPEYKDVFEALDYLTAFFKESLSDVAQDDYTTAVVELEKAAYLMAHAGANLEVGMIIFWPYIISENIMADIQSKNPYAMVLLSYFAVLFCVMEPTYWFLRGWSRRLIDMVDARLAGLPVLLEAVKWPRKQILDFSGHYCTVGSLR
ncbi:hypothetical protein ColLi_07704 [Colletotrichum liriopes]|uniref:C6 zinc finger domain-containing protein n=1 Tax=Colletotrichum liriopes TaxID=708192 RepID=A0AA37LUM5_9PEZI|nr:hypothetical protein ColLi_07704 [Colletotrichum liriopes]